MRCSFLGGFFAFTVTFFPSRHSYRGSNVMLFKGGVGVPLVGQCVTKSEQLSAATWAVTHTWWLTAAAY